MVLFTAAAEKQLAAVTNDIDKRKKEKSYVYPKVSVRLSKELDSAVKDIIANSEEIETSSQAIREALVVYYTMFQQTREGNIAGIQMKDGEFIPLFMSNEEGENVSS